MIWSSISIAFSCGFVLILVVLHFLKPEFNPSWRMISEYAIGKFGWLMRLAFILWSSAIVMLLIALWPTLNSGNEVVGRVWLIVISVALIGASIFRTNPITETRQSLNHTIHQVCGTVVIITFPIASSILGSYLLSSEYSDYQVLLQISMTLNWLGLGSFIGTIIVSKLINHKVGSDGSKLYMGWQNRFLVLVYISWIIVVMSTLK